MTATKVTINHFTGMGKVHQADSDGLAALIRKLAQDNARTRINNFGSLTDSTGATPSYANGIVAQSGKNIAAFTESGTASAQKAAFDTATGKVEDAMAVLVRFMNRINGNLGLPLITDDSAGAVATDGTIPALDLSVSAVNTSCVPYATGKLRLETIRLNMARLVAFANRIAVAVGEPKLVSALGLSFDGDAVLDEVAATGTATDGTALSTISAAAVTAELAAIGNNLSTIALFLNDITGAQESDLTGTPGGTGSKTALVAQTIPSAAVDGAATTSSPKAGFDTAIGKIEENISELGARVNSLLRRNNLTPLLTDSTGVTPNGALAAQDVALTAVDGSSGTAAVDFTTGAARMTTINNAISSLAAKVNVLAGVYGLPELDDGVDGVVSTTLANIAATGTGVGGVASTMLDTVVDAYLLACAGNVTSLMDKLNAMTGSDNTTDLPLQVVAWDV